MYVQLFVCLCCCVVMVTPRATTPLEHRVRRQAADFKIAQYRACMSVNSFYNKDCRNIGWGLVDVLRSGRRKKSDLAPLQLIMDELTNDNNDELDDTYL
ncbi:hypothetical protein KP79_PYT00289 [Mizuhopecten yessoensis]|uniref:RSamide n=1 Tax=Mizuhopecten yessoensis TaxID=6573 RepID=A0A210R1B7_MIZYE|nr:RSamide [Mizuhopecten yessoensis]OWF54853.1 hypothetical protein KP79_PYT00289 [Mizuhopecten yessoensis]